MPEVTDPRLLSRLNGPRGVQVKPADPKLPLEVQGLQLRNAQTQQQSSQDARTAPFDYRKAAADAAKAEADARAAEAKVAEEARTAEAKKGADSESQRELAQIIGNLDKLAQDATDGGGWFETGYTGSLMRDRPGTASYDLQGRVKGIQGAQLLGKLMQLKQQSSTGATGFGSLTEKEVELILGSIANLDPNQSQGQFLEAVNQAREAALAGYRRAGGKDARVDPSQAKEQPDRMGLSKDGFRDEIDPVLKGVAGRLGGMVSRGASDAEITGFLRDNGVDPANTNIGEVLRYRQTPGFKEWQRRNPGEAYPIGPDFYTNKVPLTSAQSLGNMAAQSPLGAYAISAGQAVSGNRLDDIANALGGNGEAVNTGVQLSRANSPVFSTLGDLSGQALFALGTSRLPGLSRLPNSALGRIGEDAIYGAYAGQGEGDTLGGIASNVGGGLAGRGISRGVGLGIRGAQGSAALRYLNDQGIPLTPGQIARGTGGVMGDMVANTEDRLSGIPVADAIVNTARTRGVEGVNKAAFRQAHDITGSAYPGRTGSLGLEDIGRAETQAYSFLDPLRLPVDPKLTSDLANIRAGIPGLPAHGSGVSANLDAIDKLAAGGELTGRDWQDAVRGVRMDRQSLSGKEFPRQATDALSGIEASMNDFVGRVGPADAGQNLAAANSLYRHGKVLDKAVSASPSQRRGQLFSPLTLNQQSIASQNRLGLNPNATNRPFYDLSTAALDVMPNEVPDSGTVGRGLLMAGLVGSGLGGIGGAGAGAASDDTSVGEGAAAGGGIGAAGTLLPAILLAGLYSKGGQKTLQRSLLGERPKFLRDIVKGLDTPQSKPLAETFRKGIKGLTSKRAGGMLGSAIARDVALYPELYLGEDY